MFRRKIRSNHLIPALLLVSVFVQPVLGQALSVSASVNETTIGTEEALTYSIRVEGSDGSDIMTPDPPVAEGLTLLQTTPGTGRSVQIINGQMSQSFTYTWTYRPLREGTARIEPATIRVGNRTFRTQAVDITIVPQAQRPARSPNRRLDPFSSLFSDPFADDPPATGSLNEKDIFIRTIPSKRTAWQNEQIVVEYKLYFRDGIQLRQSRLTDSWDAEGFWREELDVDTRPIPRMVIEDGLRYNTITLKKAAVFPTHAGNLTIDPLRIESEAMLPSGGGDPLRSMFSLRTNYTPVELESPAITLRANPLPPDAPPGFHGAVGDYRVSSRVNRMQLEVGESLELILTVTGTGNLATLEAPEIRVPPSFDRYEPQVQTRLDRSGDRLSGVKTFSYLLIARSGGSFELPAVEFAWFDPQANTYQSYRSDPAMIRVSGTATTPEVVTATSNGLPLGDMAPPMRTASEWVPLGDEPFHTRAWPYLAVVLPLMLVVGAALARERRDRVRRNVSLARGRRAHPLSKKHLKQAHTYLNDGQTAAFFEELERAVLGFVGNRLNVAERGLTREGLDRVLAERGVEVECRSRLKALLDRCDLGRYAPATISRSELDQAMDDASALIPQIDEQVGS